MKKFLLVFIILIVTFCYADTLKGTVTKDCIPNGFFGSWAVISKLKNTNNPSMFNYESKDIWTLSGYSNILILENLESGAHSEIAIKNINNNSKTLKFTRTKTTKIKDKKTIYKETVSFYLNGSSFSGTDNFIVETYSSTNILEKKYYADYKISGTRLSGKNPKF